MEMFNIFTIDGLAQGEIGLSLLEEKIVLSMRVMDPLGLTVGSVGIAAAIY